MYHLRLKGDYYGMGAKRGKIFEKCGVHFPLHLDGFQMRHGKASEKLLRKWFPEACEEIRGVTDALKADYAVFSAWLLCMGCCMYNLEKNIPVEVRGCTAFAFSGKEGTVYGRNNDLPPFLRKGCKSEIYLPEGGTKFSLTTSSFINGEEGMNEYGLAVAMTFVNTKKEQIRPGFNSCFIVRYLLEKAKSVNEALTLLSALPVASNCNILLADRSGEMRVAECTPNEICLRGPVTAAYGKLICTVNNFTSSEMSPYDDSDGNVYRSQERYATVMNAFRDLAVGDPVGKAEKLLRGEYGFICEYERSLCFQTVWSSVFDLDALTIRRAEGSPLRTKFKDDHRLAKAARIIR